MWNPACVTAEPEVALRPLRDSDWHAVHAWTSDERICRYQPWDPKSSEETRDYVRNVMADMAHRPQSRWVFAVEHAGEVVGSCELNLRAHQEAEVACVIRAERWGQGLATKATRQLLTLAFANFGLRRIYATCDPRNTSSASVLRRLGMRHEDRLPRTQLLRDGWRDSDVYALLASEWEPSAGTTGG
jgi:RimJ/RimL family protein N-acetyltransferase